MDIKKAVKNVLDQLKVVVDQISEDDFARPVAVLNHSTMGQHVRHTLEFFVCLINGYEKGFVNYDKRLHDKAIEGSKSVAQSVIAKIDQFVSGKFEDKPFVLEAGYDPLSDDVQQVNTTFYRELVYNIEHAIHHMALIKIGVKANCPYVKLPEGFGIAVSTIKYQKTLTR